MHDGNMIEGHSPVYLTL